MAEFLYAPSQQRLRQLSAAARHGPWRTILTALSTAPLAAETVRQRWRHLCEQCPILCLDAPADAEPDSVLLLERLDQGHMRVRLDLPALSVDAHSALALYRYLAGDDQAIDPTALDYAEVAAWQHELLSAEDARDGRDYWRRQFVEEWPEQVLVFSDALPTAGLTSDFMPAVVVTPLPAALQRELMALPSAQRELVLLTAWSRLLALYTRRPAALGVASSGRQYPDLADVIGPLARYLPIRFLPQQGQTYQLTVQQHLDAARAWQDGFDGCLAAAGRAAPGWLEFGFSTLPDSDSAVELNHLCDYFQLELIQQRIGPELRLSFRYDARVLSADWLAELADRFTSLLQDFLLRPEQDWRDVALLGPACGPTCDPTCAPACGPTNLQDLPDTFVAELISHAAGRWPQRNALQEGTQTLSYHEFQQRTAHIAAVLQNLGWGPESRIGLYLPPSIDAMIAIVGVLRAGAAFVPLDPIHPPARLAFMAQDACLDGVITRRDWQAHHPAPAKPTLLIDQLPARAEAFYPSPTAPAQLAYILYTSGSSGTPKGVMVTQTGLLNYLHWAVRDYQLESASLQVIPWHTPLAFDLSITAMLAPLVAGQCVLILPGGAEALGAALRTSPHWPMLKLTPAHLQFLLAQEQAADLARATSRLVIGGEALYYASLEPLQQYAPELLIVNEYGPTETVVGCSVYQKSVADLCACASDERIVPIGQALPNLQLYVLDEHLQSLPAGVVGEIYIGGQGVARGYVGQAALSAERFLPDPYSPEPGARLYRSGDLGWLRLDGELEYLGRADDQIKRRAYRIEPAEIEALLCAHPQVRHAAVVLNQQQLAAFLVAPPADYQAWLAERLPAYMLPDVYQYLPQLPLGPSGKVDRSRLAQCELLRTGQTRPAGNAIEQHLQAIWRELLDQEPGVEDNFFALGGDSIINLQMVTRAREVGLNLRPEHVIEYPTIAQLAAQLEPSPSLPEPDKPERRPQNIPLTPIQRWFFAHFQQQPNHYNQALLLQVPAGLSLTALQQAWTAVCQRHEAFRLCFQRLASGWRQYLTERVPDNVLIGIDLSALPLDRRAAQVQAVSTRLQASLDIQHGPLWRLALFNLGESGQRILLIAHHLLVDGLSWRIILHDLVQAYQQHSLAPARGFSQWAQVLSEAPQRWAESITYWRHPRWRACLPLPLDFPAGGNEYRHLDNVQFTLPPSVTQEVLRSQRPAALLLAALGRALAGFAASAIAIACEGHGRETALFEQQGDFADSVGWFTALYPVYLPLGASVQEVTDALAELPQRGLSYAALRYDDAAPAGEWPITQLSFNYLGQFDSGLNGPDWALAAESIGPSQGLALTRPFLIDVLASVYRGELFLEWSYSRAQWRRQTIENLAARQLSELRALLQATGNEICLPQADPADAEQARLRERFGGAAAVEAVYPLTPLQQGLLFHSLYAPGSGVYIDQFACRMHGMLSGAAFRQAWRQLLARHPILRTAFVSEDLREPLQIVLHEVDLPWREEDWSGLDRAAQAAQRQNCLEQERAQGFDFEQAPLMRIVLARLASDEWWLLWSRHHILLDGWSVALLLQDLLALLQQNAQPPPPPYGLFLDWLARQDRAEAVQFWRRQLHDINEPSLLAGEVRSGTSSQTAQRELSAEDSAQLNHFARRLGLTLASLCQAAWGLLLSHYLGRDDVVFGLTVAGRPPDLPGSEHMLGLFINTLPVRLRLRPGQRVQDWLLGLQQELAALRRYDYMPLAELQALSAIPGGSALFDQVLVYENYPLPASARAADTTVAELEVSEQPHYPFTLLILPGERLRAKALYNPEGFSAVQVQAMLEHWCELLVAIVHNEHQTLAQLPSLSTAQWRQMQAWNATEIRYPAADWCIPQAFEQQARLRPERIALSFEGIDLTYRDLDRRSNQLAHYLIERGVGLEHIIGIYMERSIELVVSILAVLKAGAAYLPLDPDYPSARLEFVLADAACPLVLTRHDGCERLPDVITTLAVDGLARSVEAYPDSAPDLMWWPEQAAYVIYTSGSTGRPKGVINTHRGLRNRLQWMQSAYPLQADDGVLQKTTISFDVSVWELLWPLLEGARLVLARPGGQRDSHYLLQLMQEQRITTVHFVPSMLEVFLATPDVDMAQACASLRRVICSGETLSLELQQRYVQRLHAPLYNLYGPTEAAIDVTHWTCRAEQTAGRVPIGHPIANLRLYVLDRHLSPVPPGCEGELYIAGVGLARHYLHRAALSAERFLPDPFAPTPGERMYRTGDRARYREDGAIEYLGRADFQIKLRGYRIEAGEIEACLEVLPTIQRAVVQTYPHPAAGLPLMAYIVPVSGTEPDPALWRDALAQDLPAYMIPSAFVCIDELPLNPNGKLDRARLPAPASVNTAPACEHAPRDVLELRLLTLWEAVLGRTDLGIYDDFFESGGHSLLALQMVNRSSKELGQPLSLADLFSARTVAGVAAQLRVSALPQTEVTPLIPLYTDGTERALFCVHPLGGTVLCFLGLARYLRPEYPVYGLQAFGIDRDEAPLDRMEDMARRYIEAIRQVQARGPYRILGYSMGGQIAYEIARQLVQAGQSVELLALVDAALDLVPTPADELSVLQEVLAGRLEFSPERLRGLDSHSQALELLAAAQAQNLPTEHLDAAALARQLQVLKAHMQALQDYQAPACELHVQLVRSSQSMREHPDDPLLGWGRVATLGVSVQPIDAQHDDLMQEPALAQVAKAVVAGLRRLDAS